MPNFSIRRFTVLVVFLVMTAWAPSVFSQADWADKVIKERNLERKEARSANLSARQGVTDETLLRLAERERHGPAVAFAVGQYFEKAKKVPESFAAFRAVVNRRDLGDKAVAYGAMSPISEDLIAAMTDSREEIDRQIAARMIAALAYMRWTDKQGGLVTQEDPKAKVQDDTPAWLKVDHTDQLKKLIETSKSRVTLECAFLAIGLDRNEALLAVVQGHTTHRVPEVACAARFAVASLGGEIDAAALIAEMASTVKAKAKPLLSFDPRQTPLAYLVMAAGEAGLVEATDPLIALLADQDIHTAVAAARALGQIGGEGLSVRLVQAMSDETPWPVRVAMYDAVGANPDAAAVPLLLERFEAETGRLRQDALHAMLSIAASDNYDQTIEGFMAWWQTKGESFEVDPVATQAWREVNKVGDISVPSFAGFYESAVISDSMVFAIDASKSIDDDELALLHQSIKDLFESLPEEIQFNLVDFGGHVRVLGKGRMVAGKVRDRALDVFLKQTELTVGTRIYEAIEASMDLPEVDTIHFLSDGQPWASQVNNWQRTDYATRLRTATVPIAVHVIYLPQKGNPVQIAKRPLSRYMQNFAEAHAGRYLILPPAKQ